VIFIPLQSISGLFSINSDVGSLRNSLELYAATALPTTFIALAIAQYGSLMSNCFIIGYVAVVRRGIDRFDQQLLCPMLCRARRGVTLELSPTPGAAATMLEECTFP
jgi:hypothetical protein